MAQSLDETDLFRSLAVYDPGLVDRCAAYVRSGTEPDLPDRLAELATQPLPADTRFGLATVGELFDILMYEPGAFHPRYGQHTKNYHVALEAVRAEGVSPIDHLRARRDYFASSAPIAMMVRLARLLACGNPDRLVDGVPPWFTVLVNEMHGKRWTGEALAEALAHAGTPATQIPSQVLLATFQTPGRWFEPNSVPRQVRGLDEYLVANSELIPPEAPNVLRADARLLLLARTSLTDGLPAVVGALTCDSSKKVRVAAIHALGRLPGQVQAEVLVSPLSRTSAPRAMEVVDYLVSTAHGSAVLTGAVAANPRLATTVAEARERRALLRQDEPTDRVRDEPQTLELPRYEPLPDEPLQLEQVERMLARRAVRDRQVAITSDYVEQLLTVANGTRPVATGSLRLVELWGYGGMQQAVAELPMLGLKHLLRLAANDRSWRWEEACALMVEPDTDLRAVEDAIVEMGLWDASTAAKVAQDAVANLVRNRWFSPRPGEESDDLRRRAAQATWPWLSQHPEVTRTWLGGDGRTAALRVLVHFPFVPHDLAPQVASIALGGGKPQRRLAQQALASHPSAQALAAQGLGHTKPETRIAAADWLTGLADATAVPVLRTALGKEKNQLVRSALLDALDALGADLDAELSPAALEAEAVAGLKRKPPVSMAWFPLDRLPALRWADGSQVPPQVPRWWVVLAVKTKNPDGSGLLDRYLSLLHPHDADLLGRTVLQAWVDYDTRRPDPAESHAYAQTAGAQAYSEAQERLTSVQGWGSTEAIASARAAAALTVEQHTAAAYAAHQATYATSAATEAGMLALTIRMSGDDLAATVQDYLRDHEDRRKLVKAPDLRDQSYRWKQIELLARALVGNGQPAAAKLLFRLTSSQDGVKLQTATELTDRLAQVHGWTVDQLADQTIATAGFEAQAPQKAGAPRAATKWALHLDLGSRQAVAQMAPDGTVAVSVAGRTVKSLPAPRADDDPELFAVAKKRLAAVRKDVKSILAEQTPRLHQAMCTGRTWAYADWQDRFADHPVMRTLVSRLIWSYPGGTFRLTDDGTCIDTTDTQVALAPDTLVGLAHATALGPQATAAWRDHLADYEIAAPPFSQLDATSPDLPASTTMIDNRQGHLTDSTTADRVATSRWYTRNDQATDGWEVSYAKTFPAVDVTAVLALTYDLTGRTDNLLKDVPAVTRSLTFLRNRSPVPLVELPPALLAECYDDYATLAAGPYDPAWRRKTHS